MWTFRQLFDPTSSTYTYLLADAGQAILIDPVFEQAARDTALLRELGLALVASVDTHVHADHVSAAWLLRRRCGSAITISAASGAAGATRLLQPGDHVAFGSRHVEVRPTPGHTSSCISLVLDDRSMAFTGDALLIRGCGRTDFQHGSAERLYRSVHEQLLTLPDDCLLYPAHDYNGLTATSVAEERRFNPRLGGDASVDDFAGTMRGLKLPHPRLIDIAVPANLRCGEPEPGTATAAPADPGWAPLVMSFGGVWQIEPTALHGLFAPVQLLDVREAAEWGEALGHIAGARLIPLTELAARHGELDPALPVVAVCRSGARSTQACRVLAGAGFGRVANLAGGMLRWRTQGLPVAGSAAS